MYLLIITWLLFKKVKGEKWCNGESVCAVILNVSGSIPSPVILFEIHVSLTQQGHMLGYVSLFINNRFLPTCFFQLIQSLRVKISKGRMPRLCLRVVGSWQRKCMVATDGITVVVLTNKHWFFRHCYYDTAHFPFPQPFTREHEWDLRGSIRGQKHALFSFSPIMIQDILDVERCC